MLLRICISFARMKWNHDEKRRGEERHRWERDGKDQGLFRFPGLPRLPRTALLSFSVDVALPSTHSLRFSFFQCRCRPYFDIRGRFDAPFLSMMLFLRHPRSSSHSFHADVRAWIKLRSRFVVWSIRNRSFARRI